MGLAMASYEKMRTLSFFRKLCQRTCREFVWAMSNYQTQPSLAKETLICLIPVPIVRPGVIKRIVTDPDAVHVFIRYTGIGLDD